MGASVQMHSRPAMGHRAIFHNRQALLCAMLASTALVQYEIDTPLITLTRKIGKDKAVRAWRKTAALAAGSAVSASSISNLPRATNSRRGEASVGR